MVDLNFEEERINFTPVICYIDYINLHFTNYLKSNFKDITPRDFTYLANILYHPNCSQRQLADLLFVSESNVTQIVKKLEKNGFVTRTVDESNKSCKIINLTDKGKLTIFSLLKIIYEWEAKFFEEYEEDDVLKFKKMIYDYSQKSYPFHNL